MSVAHGIRLQMRAQLGHTASRVLLEGTGECSILTPVSCMQAGAFVVVLAFGHC